MDCPKHTISDVPTRDETDHRQSNLSNNAALHTSCEKNRGRRRSGGWRVPTSRKPGWGKEQSPKKGTQHQTSPVPFPGRRAESRAVSDPLFWGGVFATVRSKTTPMHHGMHACMHGHGCPFSCCIIVRSIRRLGLTIPIKASTRNAPSYVHAGSSAADQLSFRPRKPPRHAGRHAGKAKQALLRAGKRIWGELGQWWIHYCSWWWWWSPDDAFACVCIRICVCVCGFSHQHTPLSYSLPAACCRSIVFVMRQTFTTTGPFRALFFSLVVHSMRSRSSLEARGVGGCLVLSADE